jgi:aryl-alcohol dehydrogenase-like predicted oxidoreductase
MSEQKLKTRTLGKSGIEVTEIGLGLWAAGGNDWGATDDKEIFDTIDFSLDSGINFYDTADVYGMGHSEELLGQSMKGRRDKFVVATKIGWAGFNHENPTTAYTTLDKFITGVESNLKRLQTDYIDIMQCHISFREPTMEIFLEGFHKLQAEGKIRAYGTSSSNFEYIKEFNADGGCATLQIDYSILNRMAEKEIFPYCQENNIGTIIRGALAMGILTGKFSPETRFGEGDFRQRWHNNPDEYKVFLEDLQKTEQLKALAHENRTLAQLALQFTLAHPAVTTVIPGAKNVKQMQDNLHTAYLPELTAEELAQIDAIVAPEGGRRIWPA